MKLSSAPFWRLSCLIRKIKHLWSVQVSFAALLFSLITFSDHYPWLLFEEAFIKVMKLSVSILEADSVHSFHFHLYFFSSGILESSFTLFTGELWHFFVSLICFADLLWLLLFKEAFIKVMELSVRIPQADSLHILESTWEVLFDR